MKSIVKTLLVTAVTAVMATSANAADLVLKFGHVGKPGSLFDMSANEFARIANAKLAGKAEVQVFGSSQLGKDKELLQKLKLGQIDFSAIFSSHYVNPLIFTVSTSLLTILLNCNSVVFWSSGPA